MGRHRPCFLCSGLLQYMGIAKRSCSRSSSCRVASSLSGCGEELVTFALLLLWTTSVLDLPAFVTLLAGCAAPDAVSRPSKAQAACFDLTHLPFGGWYFVYTLPRSLPLPRKCNVHRQSSGLGSPCAKVSRIKSILACSHLPSLHSESCKACRSS